MIFEEALSALRKGEKIRHSSMPGDEYYMACYIRLRFDNEIFQFPQLNLLLVMSDEWEVLDNSSTANSV